MSISNKNLISKILDLLPKNTSRKLLLFSLLQTTVTILDVIAIVLLGLLSKAGLDFVQGKSVNFNIPLVSKSTFQNYESEKQFMYLSMVVILLFMFRTFFSIQINKVLLKYLGRQSGYASREILKRLFESKPQYVISKNTQEIVYGVTAGVDSLVLTYLGSFALSITELLLLLALLISLLVIQPIVGVCALLIFGGSGLLIHRFTSLKARMKSEESGEISVVYSQQLIETLSLYRELYLKGSITEKTEEVQVFRDRYLKLRADLMFLPTYSKYLFEFVLILGGAFVAFVQLLFTDANAAISSLVVFLAASSRILPSIVRLQAAILSLKQSEGAGQISLRQIEEFDLNQTKENVSSTSSVNQLQESKYISIKNLSFQYPNSKDMTLREISFTVDKGQLVAIVGESGAGKSTLADLILGIQEPTSGSIKIKDESPRYLIKKYPGSLAYVPQAISIVDGSIIKNVVLTGIKDGDVSSVITSLEKASLWEEVQELPQGIDSVVGERGMKLSGGQRQRLGIARAIYSKPELIVFDEATSSLDPLTEKAVTDAIYQSRDEVTLIVIAHRLSTVKKADLVILLEQGCLVASGTFEEVRAISPKFDQQAKLVNL